MVSQRKQKRKKYQSVDHFMRDVDTMFNNAKSYNQDESQIYKDAVYLQVRLNVTCCCCIADPKYRKKRTRWQTQRWLSQTQSL